MTGTFLKQTARFLVSPRRFTFAMSQAAFSTQKPKPAHFLTTADYTSEQLLDLVHRSILFKVESKYQYPQTRSERPLAGKTVALMFSKRSTRTRVATETATAYLGKCIQIISSKEKSAIFKFLNNNNNYRWPCHVFGISGYPAWCE